MDPTALLGGGGGFQGSSAASSGLTSGPVSAGGQGGGRGFNFTNNVAFPGGSVTSQGIGGNLALVFIVAAVGLVLWWVLKR
jgi:hypothetical protein